MYIKDTTLSPIHDWYAAEQTRVAQFLHWWFLQHEKDPNSFPLNLESGEWDEQYQMWEGPDR